MKPEPQNKSLLAPLLRWLTGNANRHDEQALDTLAQGDPFLADAIEGYRSLPEADHAADVTRLKARLRQRSHRQHSAGFYLLRVAAVGVVLVAAWLVVQQFVFSDQNAVAEVAQADQAPPETASSPAMDSLQPELLDRAETKAGETTIFEEPKKEIAKEKTANTVAPASGAETLQDADLAKAQDKKDYVVADKTAPATAADEAEMALAKDKAEIALAKELAKEKAKIALASEEARKKSELEAKLRAETGSSKTAPAASSEAERKKGEAAKKKSETAAKPAPGAPIGRTIAGRVTDDNGTPLIGTSVQAAGSGIGATTDSDGRYSIALPASAESLTFSYAGYVQLQITLGKSDKLNVQLASNDVALSEVVVTVYAQSDDEEEKPIVSPRPVDGFRQFKQYVTDNLRHPEADKQPRPKQTVRVRFNIESDGSLSNLSPKGNAPQAYKDEAVRLLQQGPRWKSTAGTTASYRFVFE